MMFVLILLNRLCRVRMCWRVSSDLWLIFSVRCLVLLVSSGLIRCFFVDMMMVWWLVVIRVEVILRVECLILLECSVGSSCIMVMGCMDVGVG